MIDRETVRAFFDERAAVWDEMQEKDAVKTTVILDLAGVAMGKRVLDVACGTGIMIPEYLSRGVAHVTAIDLSPKMIEEAQKRRGSDRVTYLTGDAASFRFPEMYDAIVIYNALPHFDDPGALIAHLSSYLKPGGRLSVAHGASRKEIDSHHEGAAKDVSMGLLPFTDLIALMKPYLTITAAVSNASMYAVVGEKR